MKNEKGAIFQLLPKQRKDDGKIDILNEYLSEIPKYITLNQVNVKIAGGTDKLLVVRDVTSIVMNEQIMETKKEMSKMTDYLMNEVNEYTKDTEKKLEKLDQYVQDQGKELIGDCHSDIKKMQFRIKDFKGVYDISENKFVPIFESVSVGAVFEDLLTRAKADVKGKYMDVTLNIDKDVPSHITSDSALIKQILLNLFNQSVFGQTRGFVKFSVSFAQVGNGLNEPHLVVNMENSKFMLKPKDAQRLHRMSQENTFSKILESKSEVNYKVSKILSNALNWNVDFNAFKAAKQTVLVPIHAGGTNDGAEQVEERNENDLFNEIEGRRRDVELPMITEEKPGATGTGETEQYKLPENYPLKKQQTYPEVLLVSYSDVKSIVQDKLGFKCDEAQMETMAFDKIENALRNYRDNNLKNPFYKFILVDLDDVTIIIERMGMKLKRLLAEYKIPQHKVKLYAFSTTISDSVIANCKKGNFVHYIKPTKLQALDALRFMLPALEELERDADHVLKGKAKAASSMTAGQASEGKTPKSEIERESLLESKRSVIKRPTEEVTMDQLRNEMLNDL